MKMKKGKYLLISLLCLLSFNIKEVNAANAKVGVTENASQPGGIYGIGIKYEGQELDGFCAEQGYHLPGLWSVEENNYTCSIDSSANGQKVAFILGASGYSNEEKTAALRAVISGASVDNDRVRQLIDAANGAGSLILTKTSENNNVVTYTISEMKVLPQTLSFTCGTGCSNISYDGDKTVSVTVADGSCDYEFYATYPGSANSGGALRCSPVATGDQLVYAPTGPVVSGANPNPTTPTSGASQTFRGELQNTGSSHYQKYCANNDKNKCSDKTYVTIPTLCDKNDYSVNNAITIDEFPKDVQYCVLNGKDVLGNSFKMDDNQISSDNQYCAVYCREEYKMEMPGARFTESGRYFTLEPVKVNATRSCYATNADKNNDEPQINIEKYIEDVINYQINILNAKNAILKAQEELKQAEAAEEKDVTACDKKVGVHGVVDSTNFNGYKADKNECDKLTGICKLTRKTISTDSYKWGVTATEKEETQYDDKGVALNDKKCVADTSQEAYDSRSAVIAKINADKSQALTALIDAQTKLEKSIEWMEECYKWENNLCLDPTVYFNYEEPYNGEMTHEFQKISGSVSNGSATYHNSKTLPDRTYDINGGGTLENRDYVTCGRNENTDCALGIAGGGDSKAENISTLSSKLYYRKIISTGNGEYATGQEWSTQIPHGTVVPSGQEGNVKKNYYYLGAVFPVALKTPYGVYKWTLDFKKIGMYNNGSCNLGRLDNVLNGDKSKLQVTGAQNASSNSSLGSNLQYVCVYVIDCPDCNYECVGEHCFNPDCPDGDCPYECIDCIFDGDGDNFTYRTASVDELKKNTEREWGANWASEKGQFTKNEIEKQGEKAYIEADATFLMTAENMKKIRDYNKVTGNYVSEDLKFEKNNNDYINGASEFLRSESINTSQGRFSWRDFFKSKKLKDSSDHEYWTGVNPSLNAIVSPEEHIGPAWK